MNVEQEILFRAITGESRFHLDYVQEMRLRNTITMGTLAEAKQLLQDWGIQRQAWITKWIPGDHFYAQGKKFDRFQDAEDYLKGLGFASLGLKEVEIPRTEKEGD